jgi:hypothetical protein
MSGRPASGLMFFLGIETEPPRAGISATIRCGGEEGGAMLVSKWSARLGS